MGIEWVMHLQSMIYSRIKNEFSAEMKEKYGMTDANFSTVAKKQTNPVFPFVFIQFLSVEEKGLDLVGQTINGVGITLQIDVTDNASQGTAKKVLYEVLRILKEMRFSISSIIVMASDADGSHRSTSRCHRIIGESDIL